MKKQKTKNNRRKIILIYWLLLVVAILAFVVSAKLSADGVGVGVKIPGCEKDSYTYNQYMCAVYWWSLRIGYGLTLLMFIYAGYRYVTAGGNESIFSHTKEVFTNAIIGFLMLLMIRLLLRVLNVPEIDKCFEGPCTTSIIEQRALAEADLLFNNEHNQLRISIS